MLDVAGDDFEEVIRESGYRIALHHLLETAHLVLELLQMCDFGHVKLANIELEKRRAELLARQLSGRDLPAELFTP